LGIEINGVHKAYPFSQLTKMPETFKDKLSNQMLTVNFDKKHQTASIYDENNQQNSNRNNLLVCLVCIPPPKH